MKRPFGTFLVLLLVAGCGVPDGRSSSTFPWQLPPGFPEPIVPADNPMTVEKVELGRMLFYDRRLSVDGRVSCATCHQQRHAFADGRGVSVGVDGKPHPRQAPSLANAGYHARFNWASPQVDTLEKQLAGPLFGHGAPVVEMGLVDDESIALVLGRLRADERYEKAVRQARFDADSWGMDEVVASLASFMRTLVSGNSRVDRFMRGDANALDAQEQWGAKIFGSHARGATCHHCHDGLTFAADIRHERAPFGEVAYVNIGLYQVGPNGAYPAGNEGLFETTGRDADRGKFRVPTVRNVAVTAPYMHDGSVATLEDVMAVYQDGGRVIAEGPHAGDGRGNPNLDSGLGGMSLDADDTAAVVAFMRALTDDEFLADPRFANPFPDDPAFGE